MLTATQLVRGEQSDQSCVLTLTAEPWDVCCRGQEMVFPKKDVCLVLPVTGSELSH